MIGGIGLAILAALATASRTGLIALAAAVLVMPFFAGKGRRGAATLLTLVVIGGAGLYFTSFASSDVREHVTSASQDGGSGRTTIWRVGTRMAKANSATGVGIGNFQTSTVHYLLEPGDGITRSDHIIDNAKVAHNSYLEVWAELGIPGLTMYLLLIVAALVTALKSARRYAALALREHEAIARAVAVSIVGLAAGSFFISAENSKPLWLLLALGMVTSKLVARQEAAAA
jgi:O-antigen ligase